VLRNHPLRLPAKLPTRCIGVIYTVGNRRCTVVERVTVPEAAQRLGVSKDAVYQRIRRDTIEYERDDEGRVFVLLTPETMPPDSVDDTDANTVREATNAVLRDYVEELKERVRYLEGELERRGDEASRKDHIIMALTSRIPELPPPGNPEPPPEPRDSDLTPFEQAAKGDTPWGYRRSSQLR
jgi:excisionase family DNA binding protein